MYFVRVMFVANLQIAWEIITPKHNISPRIVRFDVAGLTPVQRAVLVNLINLTPGTLVVGISKDESTFYVHCMYAADREAAVNDLAYLKNRLLTEVF
jgi:multicomponent Na+:H+ antiporter subunit E